MENIKKLFILLIISSFLILPNVYAEDSNYLNISNNTVKTVNHSMFTAGDDVSTNNMVKGIDFTAGNNLNIMVVLNMECLLVIVLTLKVWLLEIYLLQVIK